MYLEPIITSFSLHPGEEVRDEPRRMAEVGVEVEEVIVIPVDREPHGRQHGRPEPELAGPVDDVDVGQRRPRLVRDPPRPVRRVVVDDQIEACGAASRIASTSGGRFAASS